MKQVEHVEFMIDQTPARLKMERRLDVLEHRLDKLEKDNTCHLNNTADNYRDIKKLKEQMEQVDLNLHETGRIVEENTHRTNEQVILLRKELNAMDDMINDVYVDSIQDLNNRLKVLEGVENLRTKREDQLGHLQIIGQLEEEVARFEKKRDDLMNKLKEYSEKAQETATTLQGHEEASEVCQWHTGYADGVWVSYRFLCEIFGK